MKTLLGVVIAFAAIAVPVLVLAFAPAPDAGGKSIDFKTYNGYAESRESGLKGSDSFLTLTTWAEFTHFFDPVVTPCGAPDPIARTAFDTRLFVAVIKRDDVLWDFKVEKVTANGDTLSVYYHTTPHKVSDSPRGETRKAERIEATKKIAATAKATEPKDTPRVTAKRAETKREETKKDVTERPRSSSTNFDSSLILSVPKDKYTSVLFFENGRKAGSARVGN